MSKEMYCISKECIELKYIVLDGREVDPVYSGISILKILIYPDKYYIIQLATYHLKYNL